MIFGTMTRFGSFFVFFPIEAEELNGIQAVLGFSEVKIVKPCDTRWLSHERRVKVICKELPPLLQTLSHLYEPSGDAEAYGIYSLWTIVSGIKQLSPIRSSQFPCSIKFFMLKKIADFRKLSFMLKNNLVI